MNERIEKLISESIKAIPDHVDFDLPKEFTEKFAELIVGECFVKLTPYLDDQFIDDIESELKEHFGVKE